MEHSIRDFIEAFPKEVSCHILTFLSPQDLIKCFCVSKRWHCFANTDFFWKRHCTIDLLLDTDRNITIESTNGPLCKWGKIYRAYKRKVNRWELDNGLINNIPLNNCNNVIAFSEMSLAIYYFMTVETGLEKLDIYQLCEKSIDFEEVEAFKLPGRGIVQLIKNNMYTLVSRQNFIFCMKKTAGKHMSYAAICVKSGIVEFNNKDVMTFINLRSRLDTELHLLELCDEYVWFEDGSKFIHVINLNTLTSIKISFLMKIKCMHNLVVMWSDTNVIVYSINGNALQHISINLSQSISINKNILACLCHNPASGLHTKLLLSYDLKTGQRLTQRTVVKYTDLTIHSSFDSMYILERTSRDLYRVSSVCARSGKTQWHVIVPNMLYTLLPAIIHVVSHKHLFVWPCNNSTNKYSIYNLITGHLIYTSSRFIGHIQCVKDSAVYITVDIVDTKTVAIKSFW